MSSDRTDEWGDVQDDDEPVELGTAVTVAKEKVSGRRKRQLRRYAKAQMAKSEIHSSYADDVSVFVPNVREIPPFRQYLEALWERRGFAAELARSDLKGARSSTNLGRLWGLLDPIFTAAVYYLLFTIIRAGTRPLDFLHILFAGILIFQFVTGAMTDGSNSIARSSGLMLNSAFPAALLPISAVYGRLLKLAPSAIVYIALHVILGAPYGWGLLYLPLLFIISFTMAIGLALTTATIAVFFKDTKNFLAYITRLFFFTSPVIYPAVSIPDNLRVYLVWQPLFGLFSAYQAAFDGLIPNMWDVIAAALWTTALLVIGVVIFMRYERDFASRI